MDLYEALRSGTSAAELVTAFNKELEEANARIAAEKEAEEAAAADKQYLDECRTLLAETILDYAEACFGDLSYEDEEDYGMTIEDVEKALKNFEQEMEKTMSFMDQMKEYFKDANVTLLEPEKKKTDFTSDDEVIKNFLKKNKINNTNKFNKINKIWD